MRNSLTVAVAAAMLMVARTAMPQSTPPDADAFANQYTRQACLSELERWRDRSGMAELQIHAHLRRPGLSLQCLFSFIVNGRTPQYLHIIRFDKGPVAVFDLEVVGVRMHHPER